MAGLTRKERQHEQSRQEILAAALDLFSEKGFHTVSMQQVAEKAGFAVGTLYNFFSGKEELFAALMRLCAERVAEVVLPILDQEGLDEREKVTQFIRAQRQIIEQNAATIRLYLSQIRPSDLTISSGPEKDGVIRMINVRLAEVLRAGMEKGVFQPMDPLVAANLLGSMMEASAFMVIREPDKIPVAEVNRCVESLFLHGLWKDARHE